MARKKTPPKITIERLSRFYRLLSLLKDGPIARVVLLKRLKIDLRSFYRDLEKLREIGLQLSLEKGSYSLTQTPEQIAKLLPFPMFPITLHEAMILADGKEPIHGLIQVRIDQIFGES